MTKEIDKLKIKLRTQKMKAEVKKVLSMSETELRDEYVNLSVALKAKSSNTDCSRCYDCSDCSCCYDCSDCSCCSDCSDCSCCSHCSDCSDCSRCSDCSNCPDCSCCYDCSDCSYCSYCSDCSCCSHCSKCSDCSDCSDCSRCSYCFNQANKKYMVLNIQLTETEYFGWIQHRNSR